MIEGVCLFLWVLDGFLRGFLIFIKNLMEVVFQDFNFVSSVKDEISFFVNGKVEDDRFSFLKKCRKSRIFWI